MANQITGRVIAVSKIETIASTREGAQPMTRRKLFMDCTRFDPYTGERGFENTPLIEFGGKALEKLNDMVAKGLKKDDIVRISFDVQGSKYKNQATGKPEVFTRIRPYDIELFVPQGQQQAPQQTQQAPAAQQQAPAVQQQAPQQQRAQEEDLPF